MSKALIAGAPIGDQRLVLQSREAYDDAAIELRLGVRAIALEAADGRLLPADGSRVSYDRLVIAVGGEPAPPPQLIADVGDLCIGSGDVRTPRAGGVSPEIAVVLNPGAADMSKLLFAAEAPRRSDTDRRPAE